MNSPDDPTGMAETAPAAESAATRTTATGSRLGLPAKLGLAALAVCALAALFWPKGTGSFQEPGGSLYDSAGRSATIGSRLAPVTLVHFWATWCPPCIQEAPKLARLTRDFSDRSDFAVLMVRSEEHT